MINDNLREVAAGRLDRLAVFMPPRHGKSLLISQFFPAWFLLVFPWRRVVLCSYEASFAASWGRKVRDALAQWGRPFGCLVDGGRKVAVRLRDDNRAADRWEVSHYGGGMYTAGVGGPILGKGADLLILDDLVKNAEEALSPTYRQKTWDWLTSTAFTRLEPGAAVVHVQQRWHTDDVGGRMLAAEPGRWKVLKLPALAEADDPLGRQPGEALWPERYPKAELEERRRLAPRWFDAQYQQRPLDLEGGFFRGLEKIAVVNATPAAHQFSDRVRFWDLASTEAQAGVDPDWTVGVLMGRHKDGTFWVLDIARERLGPKGVRRLIRQTAERDGHAVRIRLEREGGASGKIAASAIVTEELAGWAAEAVPVKGSKAERAEPWAAQVEAGNVSAVNCDALRPFLDEHRAFPGGAHDDTVDAASGAFAALTRRVVAGVL